LKEILKKRVERKGGLHQHSEECRLLRENLENKEELFQKQNKQETKKAGAGWSAMYLKGGTRMGEGGISPKRKRSSKKGRE